MADPIDKGPGSNLPWRVIREDRTAGDITYAIVPPNEGATIAWVPEDCNDHAKRDAEWIAAVANGHAALVTRCERYEQALRRIESRDLYGDECAEVAREALKQP